MGLCSDLVVCFDLIKFLVQGCWIGSGTSSGSLLRQVGILSPELHFFCPHTCHLCVESDFLWPGVEGWFSLSQTGYSSSSLESYQRFSWTV